MKAAPKVYWRAVAAGVLLAGALALPIAVGGGATTSGATTIGLAASLFGCAGGGFLAGKLAGRDGAYQGTVVGACWIGLEAIGVAPTTVGLGLTGAQETVVILGFDALLLTASTAGGWLATRGAR